MRRFTGALLISVPVLAICITGAVWIAHRPIGDAAHVAPAGQAIESDAKRPRLSSEEAIAIAQAKLRELKRDPEEFDPPEARYSADDQRWGVTFWPKSHRIEGDVFVIIDDKTGSVVGGLQGLAPF